MHRMAQAGAKQLYSCSKIYFDDFSRDHLERIEKCRKINPRWRVLISYCNHRFPFRSVKVQELYRIANQAYIARVRMKQIYRPVLRFLAVVAEGPRKFKFDCPMTRDK